MVTIAHIVRKIIEKKPFLEAALAERIINNAALAEKLMPEIAKELNQKVKFSAVNLAIRRFAETLGEKTQPGIKFGKESDISVKSSIIEIVLFKTENIQEYVKKLYDIVDFRKGDYLSITQGNSEVMVYINEKHEKKALGIIPPRMVKKKIRNLSTLTLTVPESAVDTPGIFYVAAKALNWENINIIDIVSTYTEMTFIVKEENTASAFNILKRVIDENR
jgi:aspartokinase